MRALAATFAHELNQPLGVAANYLGAATRMLSRSTPEASKVLGYLESTKDQIDHIGQIIEGARELVAHSGSNSQEAKVVEIIDSVIILLRGSESGRHVRFQIETTRGAENIRANVAQLKQVLFNLSRNAVEAVPANRIPSIEYSVRLNVEGLIQFEITDNGTGFKNFPRDPFATLSTTKKNGLGLGLSLSRTIVEAHGGKIWIKQTGMDGTTLAFTLQTGDAVEGRLNFV
jgi:two-component system sensor kinase FixL